MLILASTSDKLRLTSSSTANLDVHVSWVDRVSSTSNTPGRTNTGISSATTTDIVASPASATYRLIRTLTVRNRHASTSQEVTIIHTDGTNAMELIKCTLSAGECLHYNEKAGFWQTDSQGRAKQVEFTNVGTPTSDSISTVVLGSDVINNNATLNTIQDVTGISFSVLSGKTYWFEFFIWYTAAASTTGSRWSINGPASPTLLNYESRYTLTNASETRNALLQAYDLPAASNATSSVTAANWAKIEGMIRPSADGTVIARFASEVANSAITAKTGSFVRYQQLD
jgi:hypothetical protein